MLRRGRGSVERNTLELNPQGNGSRGRSRRTWNRIIKEKALKEFKT
jgi:hypothetical protein